MLFLLVCSELRQESNEIIDGDIELNLRPSESSIKSLSSFASTVADSRVALKFMKIESQYIREVEARCINNLDGKFVIQMIEHYDDSDRSFLKALKVKVKPMLA
jgi:hypothetical protein